MHDPEWLHEQAARSLERLVPRLRARFARAGEHEPAAWQAFERRLGAEWQRLFQLLVGLYGHHYDFFYHLEELLAAAAQSWLERPAWLKQRDAEREQHPGWFLSQQLVGGVVYVDRFSGTLARLREHIPYIQELGVNYLHLMPLFKSPAGKSDGGYAVSSYREVDQRLGTLEDLQLLAQALHEQGISLVLDFVFNHTSEEHEWALRARQGDPVYQQYYYMFPDRSLPDLYERTLREIFPTIRRGSFTYYDSIRRWVWTTFNSFQWDLNYANPATFRAMAAEMLFIANLGVEFLRLDAVAFIWKRMGTSSENLPEAHLIIQAFNAIARIAAPSLLFKSEAIVHPDDVLSYINPGECQISYNPLLMALLWEALATRQVQLLAYSMRTRFRLPDGCAWVNYLRSHDDIGWTFDDADAQHLAINPAGHRQFLTSFYTGRFPGSFARGLPFQENPDTGDARVSGTLASLAGLEQALHFGDEQEIELAIRRILMLHSIILSIGGIPLIYLGDEVGTLNDYDYVHDPHREDDSRWVHRPVTDWQRLERRHAAATPEGRIFAGLTRLIKLRKASPALWDSAMEVIETGSPQLFAYTRHHAGERLIVVANFSEHSHSLAADLLRVYGPGYHFVDVIQETPYSVDQPLQLGPYGFVWLKAAVKHH